MSYPSLSWNRIPRIRQSHIEPLATARFPSKAPRPFLAQGNGRSYGDVCLNAEGTLLLTRGLDKLAALTRNTVFSAPNPVFYCAIFWL